MKLENNDFKKEETIYELKLEEGAKNEIFSESSETTSSESTKTDDLVNFYTKDGYEVYRVLSYSYACEDHNKISLIIPLVRSTPKYIIYIILNILTVGIIQLVIAWFPKIILYIYYSITNLENATHLGIFSKEDKEFEDTELDRIDLPPIDYDNDQNIAKRFNLNIFYGAKQIIIFEYKIFKYIFSPNKKKFDAIYFQIKAPHKTIIDKFSTGLNPNEVLYMRKIFGVCDLDIKINSCGKILFDELTDPFYLFQLYALILWYCTDYYVYSTVMLVLTSISLILSVYDTNKNLKKIQEISKYSCPVKVIRKNENNELCEPIEINSTELVPGDIFILPEEGLAMPCDAILIHGQVIMNEAILTGESTPVIKYNMTYSDVVYNTNNIDYDKYMLFAGTKIVQKRKIGEKEVIGMVYSIGFHTFKGSLITGILYPKEMGDDFFRDSVKYIILMGILTLVGFFVSLKFLIVEGGCTKKEIIEILLDLFTTTVPPSLPTCLSIGITYSLSRLNDKGIFCIRRDRINMAGKVNILVFDKTGTLTENSMDKIEFITVKINPNKEFEFNPLIESILDDSNTVIDYFKKKGPNYKDANKDLLQYYIECLACCHHITYVNDSLVGDSIDVKMFESLDWIMKDNINITEKNNYDSQILNYIMPKSEEEKTNLPPGDVGGEKFNKSYKIGIVKKFLLSNQLQRMTVIGKNINENYFKVFCKGSPENIKALSIPSTIPKNFDEILNLYTLKGYRVLGVAAKSIIVDFSQIQAIQREQVEKKMLFLGFIIFRNKLKEKTIESIDKYDKADLRMLMATGDNVLTSINIAKECNLIQNNKEIILCNIINEQNKDILKWTKLNKEEMNQVKIDCSIKENEISNNNLNINTATIKDNVSFSIDDLYPPEKISPKVNKKIEIKRANLIDKRELNFLNDNNRKYAKSVTSMESSGHSNIRLIWPVEVNEDDFPSKLYDEDEYTIAIRGQTFEKLFKLEQAYAKNKDEGLKSAHEAFRLILNNGTVFARMTSDDKRLLISSLNNEGFITLMCGDGTNDCSALRTAHTSVSLSAEEASIAASFSSNELNISCVFNLLREGKCSLTNSIQTFKFMMLYSMIQFVSVILMYIFSTELSDFQYIVSDLFIIFPLEFFSAMIHPYEKLTYHYPNAHLLTFPIIFSIVMHTIIVICFQFLGYKILKWNYKWENICDYDDNDRPLPCHENTIIYMISHFQYFASGIAFFVSAPFRQRIYTNWMLVVYLIITYSYSIWITINCDKWSKKLFGLFDLEEREREDKEEEEKEEEEENEEEENDEEENNEEEEINGEEENNEEEENIEVETEEETIPGGKNIKYFLLLIIAINTIITVAFEWYAIKLINYFYDNSKIKSYKAQIIYEKKIKQSKNQTIKEKEVKLHKYQKIYYYDRRNAQKQNV